LEFRLPLESWPSLKDSGLWTALPLWGAKPFLEPLTHLLPLLRAELLEALPLLGLECRPDLGHGPGTDHGQVGGQLPHCLSLGFDNLLIRLVRENRLVKFLPGCAHLLVQGATFQSGSRPNLADGGALVGGEVGQRPAGECWSRLVGPTAYWPSRPAARTRLGRGQRGRQGQRGNCSNAHKRRWREIAFHVPFHSAG
jgi:hypothetical protein